MLAISHSSVLPSAHWNSVGALISDPFLGSITLPACSVNASRAASRLPAHDSGPGWLATPYLYDSCIRDFTPVYPGALQLRPKFPKLHCQAAPRSLSVFASHARAAKTESERGAAWQCSLGNFGRNWSAPG